MFVIYLINLYFPIFHIFPIFPIGALLHCMELTRRDGSLRAIRKPRKHISKGASMQLLRFSPTRPPPAEDGDDDGDDDDEDFLNWQSPFPLHPGKDNM